MMPSFCQDSVKILRAPLVDERGTKVRNWTNATEHTIYPCSVQPASTSAYLADRENLHIKMTLYAESNADIKKFDRVVFNDETFEIDGAPYIWKSPSGATSHKICSLISTDG